MYGWENKTAHSLLAVKKSDLVGQWMYHPLRLTPVPVGVIIYRTFCH